MTNDLTEALRPLVAKLVAEELAKHTAPVEYLSIQEAARVASVSPSTVRRWLATGALPEHRVDRVIRIHRAELDTHLSRPRRRVANANLTPEQMAERDFG